MATYQGERFIRAQIESILAQLGDDDELIIVDDGSTDSTLALVEALGDARITIHRNPVNLRPPRSFARAMSLATTDVIVLADQDDEWIDGRLDALVDALLTSGAVLVSSNSEYVDAAGDPVRFPMRPLRASDSSRRMRNLAGIFRGSIGYYGCAMALRASFRSVILPIPRWVEAHDLWIAMAANLAGANLHLERATLRRRIHGNNASVIRRPIHRKLWARVKFTLALFLLSRRLRLHHRPRRSLP